MRLRMIKFHSAAGPDGIIPGCCLPLQICTDNWEEGYCSKESNIVGSLGMGTMLDRFQSARICPV